MINTLVIHGLGSHYILKQEQYSSYSIPSEHVSQYRIFERDADAVAGVMRKFAAGDNTAVMIPFNNGTIVKTFKCYSFTNVNRSCTVVDENELGLHIMKFIGDEQDFMPATTKEAA